MTTFYVLIGATLAFDFALLGVLVWAFHSSRLSAYRIPGHQPMKVPAAQRIRTMMGIGTLSFAITVGAIWSLTGVLLDTAAAPAWRIALEGLAILAVYDFAYYFMHRGFHHPKVMRFIHGVHHRVRHPTALESLYMHPFELLGGLGLLLASAWLVGPVHPYAFAAAFFVYSTLNILIHSGMDFPVRLLAPINFLTRKHQVHHATNFRRNYASLTPLPDFVFRTLG